MGLDQLRYGRGELTRLVRDSRALPGNSCTLHRRKVIFVGERYKTPSHAVGAARNSSDDGLRNLRLRAAVTLPSILYAKTLILQPTVVTYPKFFVQFLPTLRDITEIVFFCDL